MAVLNRQQVQEIVNTRPKDMSEEDAIRDIISRGTQLKDYLLQLRVMLLQI